MAFFGLLVSVTLIASTAYSLTQRQRRTKHQAEDKNRVLEALHELSILALRTEDIDDLLRQSLDSISELMPDCAFAIALSEPGRPATFHHLQARGFSGDRVQALTERLGRVDPARLSGEEPLQLDLPGSGCLVVPLGAHLSQLNGVLAISCTRALDADAWQRLQLFEDHIASLIQNQLLTARLTEMAETDPLTGVYNRAYFREALSWAEQKKCGPAGMDYAIVLVDMNGLKEVNDRYGHEVGDRVILKVVELLRSVTRSGDRVVRMGGDEFVVLCLNCDSR